MNWRQSTTVAFAIQPTLHSNLPKRRLLRGAPVFRGWGFLSAFVFAFIEDEPWSFKFVEGIVLAQTIIWRFRFLVFVIIYIFVYVHVVRTEG